MSDATATLACRQRGEWSLQSSRVYDSPFADVAVEASFIAPSGAHVVMPGFHDGAGIWRVRFNPGEPGAWRYSIAARPHDPELAAQGRFTVTPATSRGFLRATPGTGWGFEWESGEPAFIFGDTVYNLFGMAHCGIDVAPFLERRAAQGFNLLRIRVPVSSFHPEDAHSDWQTRRTWAWGGSEQAPRFDLFNLDWFRTVDAVMALTERLGIGVEMIMEGWGFEFPFSHRTVFTTEWEELWMRYLIARYDAHANLAIWTPLNEYEYYPNGDWHHKPVADRWAMRVARWIKATAPHGHVVAMHNGPRMPPFAERFRADPEAVDAVLYQDWGSRGEHDGWLAAGLEEQIAASLAGWRGSAVLAEWGYERNPALPRKIGAHDFCDRDHTRRGAWRGAFQALGLIHGFENSWGPWLDLEHDQEGMADLLQLRRFFTELVPFADLRPLPPPSGWPAVPSGHRPSLLAGEGVLLAYLPVGGGIDLTHVAQPSHAPAWFDPRSGELLPADPAGPHWTAPSRAERADRPDDWVLVFAPPRDPARTV